MKTLAVLLALALLLSPAVRAAEPAPAVDSVQQPTATATERWDVALNVNDAAAPVPPTLRPYDAVGLIENATRTRTGTGFLIGPCTVLTAYHVLFPEGEAPSKKAVFTFALGHGLTHQFELVLKAKPVFWGNFSYLTDTPTEDFAVLNVPSCPGRRFLPIQLAPMSLADIAEAGGRLRDAGYPMGHSWGRVWGDEDCTAGGMHPLEPALFAIDCYSRPGMSGGPVLAEKDGQLLAVAIMSRVVLDPDTAAAPSVPGHAAPADLARLNLALPVSAFFGRLTMMGLVGQ